MNRLLCTFALLSLAACTHVPSESPSLPTEVDTIVFGRTVVLSTVRGGIFRKVEGGALIPITDGASIELGEMLLVRKGASFSIGRTTFGPEHHGDRWVQFQ